MFRSIVCLIVFLVLIGCALPTRAQRVPTPATLACSYFFISGNNNTYLNYCVTANGNIAQLQTPLGENYFSMGEGYGLCNESPAVEYYDYAYEDSGNWNSATLVSQTATSVQIARTTNDGNWTLTQTITQVAATSSIKIAMKLKNNTSTSRVAYLIRYSALSPRGGGQLYFSATQNSSFTWWAQVGQPGQLFGLMLQTVGTPPSSYSNGFAQNTFDGPNACAFAFNSPGGAFQGVGSSLMAYVVSVPANKSKTFTVSYKGM